MSAPFQSPAVSAAQQTEMPAGGVPPNAVLGLQIPEVDSPLVQGAPEEGVRGAVRFGPLIPELVRPAGLLRDFFLMFSIFLTSFLCVIEAMLPPLRGGFIFRRNRLKTVD